MTVLTDLRKTIDEHLPGTTRRIECVRAARSLQVIAAQSTKDLTQSGLFPPEQRLDLLLFRRGGVDEDLQLARQLYECRLRQRGQDRLRIGGPKPGRK